MEIAVKVNSGLSDGELQALGDKLLKANLASVDASADNIPSLVYHGLATENDGSQSLRTESSLNYTYLIPRSIGGDGPSSTNILVRSRITSNNGDTACV
ncbi:MAG: hypothetical protein E5V26_02810, partial [Mesorhizobium sp.]